MLSAKLSTKTDTSKAQAEAIAELKKYYPQLPENLVIEGNLNLAERRIKKLPNGLTIRGSLDLRYCWMLDQFPTDLTVMGNLYFDSANEECVFTDGLVVYGNLEGVKDTQLVDNMTIGGDLVFKHKYIRQLPNNLTVGGSLDVSRGPKDVNWEIKQLPKGLKVMGNLNLTGQPIEELPDDLYVGGNLLLSNTKISRIPETLKVNGSLCIQGTNVRSLPKNLTRINGCLYIGNTKIKALPDNMFILDTLDISESSLRELPEGLHVGEDLWMENSLITEFPENFFVGGDINAEDSNFEVLPKKLHLPIGLNISDTEVSELPADLKIGGWLDIRNTNITAVPAMIDAEKFMPQTGKLKTLPTDFHVTGTLDLDLPYDAEGDGWITSLPDGLSVGGDLQLGNCGIKKLPSGLKVGGDLFMEQTVLTSIPEDAFIGGGIFYEVMDNCNMLKFLSGEITFKYPVYFNEKVINEWLKFYQTSLLHSNTFKEEEKKLRERLVVCEKHNWYFRLMPAKKPVRSKNEYI